MDLKIIPVIDIKSGKAVHAVKGERANYHPLNTELCTEGDPYALIDALRSRFPFSTIYIADLDALMGQAPNRNLIQNLTAQFANIRFWIDQGFVFPDHKIASDWPWTPVIGTESLDDSALKTQAPLCPEPAILSLDFAASGFLGPHILLASDEFWPQRVIVMSLVNVGAEQGPNWELLSWFKRKWPQQYLIAAGGVRNEQDLKRLAESGFDGVLVATALHRGRIGVRLIEHLIGERRGF